MNLLFSLGMKGGYCQIIDNNEYRFFEIHVYKYEEENIRYLKKHDSLEDSVLGSYIQLINKPIPSNTRFLFKLMTYVGKNNIDDLFEFNQNIKQYQEHGFYDLDDLLSFCQENWGLVKDDFGSITDTSIPF